MPDFREQIQKHFEAKELSPEKVEAILATGQAAAAGEKIVPLHPRKSTGRWTVWAVAASIVVLAGLALWWRNGVSYQEFAPQVVAFFRKDPELPERSQNPEELRKWLIAQGGPEFEIPTKLGGLKSFGCQVIQVQGKSAYLACFWSEKKPGVDQGELVHLLVARRSDFQDAPPSESPEFREIGDWSFAAWTEGDVVYTMAAKAPLEKLKTFLSPTGKAVALSYRDAGRSG